MMFKVMDKLKIVSWNIGKRPKAWSMLQDGEADVALLQEVGKLPTNLPSTFKIATAPAYEVSTYDRWPVIVQLSDRVRVEGFKPVSLMEYSATQQLPANTLAVSDPTTIAMAAVTPAAGGEPFYVASIYGRWLKPHHLTKSRWWVGYPDASIHRAISDLSVLIGSLKPETHRLLVAGDFNMIYGATPENKLALPARDQSVIDRFKALGLEFLGPQFPAGRQALPTPSGLPETTKNVPTYYTPYEKTPQRASNQLDYVFASQGFHRQIEVRALNEITDWGPSDHCRLLIEISL